MDESNKTWNHDQDKKHKKMVIKFGGGGIGAVILLGGALATAALASAFAARRHRRSSGKDRRSYHRNPPPENDKLSEQDESKNDTVSLVSSESLTLDVELNGVSDDGFVIVDGDFPQSGGKLPIESLNKMIKDEQTEGDVSDDYSEEKENQEQVYIEEEPKQGENIEIVEVDRGVGEEREEVEGFFRGDEEMMSEKKCVEIEEGGSGLHNQIGEVVLEDEESLNDEKLVEKQEECEEKQRNEIKGMIEEREEKATFPYEKNKEEIGYLIHQTPDEATNDEAEFDVSPQTTNEGIENAKDLETSEEEIVGSEDSSSEAVWPAKSKVGGCDDQTVIKDKYYMVEMGMKKDGRTNSSRRRAGIATFSLLSSLSCSWFFGLSFTKLCLLVFLTMVLSELHGF